MEAGTNALNAFEEVAGCGAHGLRSVGVEVIQVNVGLRCNQSCLHCHVECSPDRIETVDWPTMEKVVLIARQAACTLVDITGGAPEMNPNLARFITALRAEGIAVQVRTNFTAMLEPGNEDLPRFFQQNGVQLVGSMPCYLEENVDAQRGLGTHGKSIDAIRRLNALGYGHEPELVLNLVYNPVGPQLPPAQDQLEADYRRELSRRHGVVFTHLLTITNMPVGRFRTHLRSLDMERDYMDLLVRCFNKETLDGLMCRRQISIGWDGTLYDCDFNIALGMPVDHGVSCDLGDFDLSALSHRQIVTGDHCFGCTAGCGSSCGGALVEPVQEV